MSGYLGIWVSGYLGVWVSGYLDVWVSGCMGIWVSWCLGIFVYGFLGVWVSGCLGRYVANGHKNYQADQDEIYTTYSLRHRDGSAQKKIEKNSKKGPKGPFLLKNAFFSNNSIIYYPIELKL